MRIYDILLIHNKLYIYTFLYIILKYIISYFFVYVNRTYTTYNNNIIIYYIIWMYFMFSKKYSEHNCLGITCKLVYWFIYLIINEYI